LLFQGFRGPYKKPPRGPEKTLLIETSAAARKRAARDVRLELGTVPLWL
jgi:hypothetical protein